jgi:hypothetical protein
LAQGPAQPDPAADAAAEPEPPAASAEKGSEEIETEVVFTDGRRLTGVLIERSEVRLVLKIAGIPTEFSSESVAQVIQRAPARLRFIEMRKTIEDRDIDQRLRLVEWARNRGLFTQALAEVEDILVLEPTNADARALKLWLDSQLKLKPKPASKPPAGTTDKQPGGPAPGPERPAGKPEKRPEVPLLSQDQINLIRVYETDLNDPPRMLVDRDLVQQLITDFPNSELVPQTREGRESLFRKRPEQILELLFKLRARHLYGRVQVMEDPRAVRLFRERVHASWLMNSCATNQCHGGTQAGRLWLATKKPNADATVYTNLLTLERFKMTPRAAADNRPGPTSLIDFDDPARSPLLQMGLPRAQSLTPHPQIVVGGRQRGFAPVFQATDDKRYQDAIEWIRSMYRPRPNYLPDFQPAVPPNENPDPNIKQDR